MINQLIHADCMDIITEIKSESIDLVILDPNYQDWSKLIDCGMIEESLRVLKKTGNIITFCQQPYDFELRKKIDPFFRREFIWSFKNGGAFAGKNTPLISHQKFFWGTKSSKFYFNPRTGLDYETNKSPNRKKTKKFKNSILPPKKFEQSKEGTWIRDHYHISKPKSGKIRAKPSVLFQVIIKCFCPEDGIVLDPFFGSGNTAFESKKQGKNFIGIEIEIDNINLYNDKIKK